MCVLILLNVTGSISREQQVSQQFGWLAITMLMLLFITVPFSSVSEQLLHDIFSAIVGGSLGVIYVLTTFYIVRYFSPIETLRRVKWKTAHVYLGAWLFLILGVTGIVTLLVIA